MPRIRRAWAAGLTGLAAAAAAVVLLPHAGWQTYATAVGEQRSIELADRSTMHLNGLTRVQVRFSTKARDVRLLDGEALFKVARDAARPFRVRSGASVIQAVGTQFNVLHRSTGTVVAVMEGAVQVSTQRLTAGEEARIAPDGRIAKRAAVDIVAISAWRRHRLVFRADTLTDVAAEFNRYNRAPQIVVEGDVSRARRYSGVFDANDPRSLMEYLRGDSELVLDERPDELVIRVR